MIEVLAAAPIHAEIIATIHEAAVVEPWEAGFIVALLEKPSVYGFLAVNIGVPIGFVLVQVGADEAEILNLATLPAARRKGAAKALVISATEQLKGQGVAALFLEVAEDNGPACRLYEGLGFAQAGSRKNYYKRGDGTAADALQLRLNLVEAGRSTK